MGDQERDGFSNAVAQANEKMGRGKQSRNGTGGIFGCFFCCGPKSSASASTNRKRHIPPPEKRNHPLGETDEDNLRTKNGLTKAPKQSVSPKNTFKPAQGDAVMFSPNSKLNGSL